MKTMRITNAEVKLIEEYRQDIKHKKATERFRKDTLKLAYQFNEYLLNIGEFASFSGFINCFDPPPSNPNFRKMQYEAVKQILDTVRSLEIHRGAHEYIL